MNGIAEKIFTVVFSGLRGLFNAVWGLLSDGGGGAISFFSQSWMIWLIVLLLCGFVFDISVYLVRWRPFRARRERLERAAGYGEDDSEPVRQRPYARPRELSPVVDHAIDMPDQPEYLDPYSETGVYASQTTRRAPAPYAQVQPTMKTKRVPMASVPVYQPYERQRRSPDTQYTNMNQTIPMEGVEGYDELTRGVSPSFGSPKPEPPMYFQDMQRGYAPQLSDEELYARPNDPPATPAASEPVHPGLDNDVFHQNLGLDESGSPEERQTLFRDSTYVPYYQKRQEHGEAGRKSFNGLRQLAKRASLLADSDERNAPSLRDLQPAKDLRQAFHAPVYPKNYQRPEE